MKKHSLKTAGVLLLIVAFSGCTFAPTAISPPAEKNLPDQYSLSSAGDIESALWWQSAFNDPTLNQIVDSVLSHNNDLQMAVERIDEVKNLYKASRAGLFPTIAASGNRADSDTPSNVGFASNLGGGPTFPSRFENTTYSAQLALSYELDVWGKVRGGMSAGRHSLSAVQATLRVIQTGVITETVNTYFEILDTQKQIAFLEGQTLLMKERVELTEKRYQAGLAPSFEMYNLRQSYEETRSNIPLLKASLVDARGRLSILLGGNSHQLAGLLDQIETVSVSLEMIPAGLPSTLLENRPDVVAAYYQMEAARAQAGVAKASRFPSFSLTAVLGVQSGELADITNFSDQKFTNFSGGFSVPLFAGGALKANQEAAYSRYKQSVLNYDKAVLSAFRDVESALNSYKGQQERYQLLKDELDWAQKATEATQDRYRQGIANYTALLDARRNLLRVESVVASSERALISTRTMLHRALGGNWISE